MTLPVHIIYHGRPSTKKTSQKIARRRRTRTPFILPSDAYRAAVRTAVPEIHLQVLALGGFDPLGSKKQPLHVEAIFCLGKKQVPDLSGLIEACGDILQTSGLISNDYWILSWDGSRRERDPENPRTVVTVRRYLQMVKPS